jgi:curli production assembly/transport component CsgE
MQIVNTQILMVMIFLGTSGQPSISGNSFLEMYPSVDPIDLEIEGLVVDATATKVGRDFYDVFFSKWEPDPSLPSLSITVTERPLPNRGSQIIVSMEDNIIFQRFVQPRYDALEENAELAVRLALNYLNNYEMIQKQLQGDDLSGSGIY